MCYCILQAAATGCATLDTAQSRLLMCRGESFCTGGRCGAKCVLQCYSSMEELSNEPGVVKWSQSLLDEQTRVKPTTQAIPKGRHYFLLQEMLSHCKNHQSAPQLLVQLQTCNFPEHLEPQEWTIDLSRSCLHDSASSFLSKLLLRNVPSAERLSLIISVTFYL